MSNQYLRRNAGLMLHRTGPLDRKYSQQLSMVLSTAPNARVSITGAKILQEEQHR